MESKCNEIDRNQSLVHACSFNCIYTGNTSSHKINKLQENTSYHFRICAKNDTGAGPWSEVSTFTTTKAAPNALKGTDLLLLLRKHFHTSSSLAPNITEITSTSCVFHWQAHKPLGGDVISYILQLQIYRKESDFTEIYHGELTSYRASNLESGVEYRARVCAIRTTSEGLALNSPFSPSTQFVLPRPEDLAAALSASKTFDSRSTNSDLRESHLQQPQQQQQQSSSLNRCRSMIYRKFQSIKFFENRTLTDQQWAFVISVGFALLAIFIAIFANVIYSKYNHDSTISVEKTFSSATPSGIKQ